MRGLSGRGASRLARAGVLEQYVEHGKQAQRSPGGRIACFDRRVVRKAGQAKQHGFTIVSKDGDFSGRSFLYGAPPKVIWLAVGNRSTSEIERCLREHRKEIETFATATDTTLLVITPGQGAGTS